MLQSHFIFFWSSRCPPIAKNTKCSAPSRPRKLQPPGGAGRAGRSGQANRRVLVVAAIVALAAIAAGGRMWYRSHYYVETENAYVAGHVHPVSSRISGVVTKVLIDDNQIVKEGDVIAELDPFDQRVKVEQIQAQIASAEQQVAQSDAQIAQTQAQASGAAAQVAQSEAQLVRAKQDAERYGQLYNSQMKAVSKAELDTAVANRASAAADLAARKDSAVAAKAQITAANSARDVLKAQVRCCACS
jgi:membrane fusion protein (multidrug efflux system)